DEIFVLERDLLEAQRQLEQRIVRATELGEHLVAHLANDLRAWIEVLVDAVPEAHQPEMAGLVLGHRKVLGNVLHRADLLEHRQYGFVRSAVSWSPQRRHAS